MLPRKGIQVRKARGPPPPQPFAGLPGPCLPSSPSADHTFLVSVSGCCIRGCLQKTVTADRNSGRRKKRLRGAAQLHTSRPQPYFFLQLPPPEVLGLCSHPRLLVVLHTHLLSAEDGMELKPYLPVPSPPSFRSYLLRPPNCWPVIFQILRAGLNFL